MARNVTITILRGIKANIPALNPGEMYLATDEVQLYVGSATGNKLALCNTVGVGNGGSKAVMSPQKGTGAGPANPLTVVQFTKIVIGGVTYWMPLMQ